MLNILFDWLKRFSYIFFTKKMSENVVDDIIMLMAKKTGNILPDNKLNDNKTKDHSKNILKRKLNENISINDKNTSKIWNPSVTFDITCISERKNYLMNQCFKYDLLINPFIEIQRQKYVKMLKQKLETLANQIKNTTEKVTNSSFQIWQFSAKLDMPKTDPLLPHGNSDISALRDELIKLGGNKGAIKNLCKKVLKMSHKFSIQLQHVNQNININKCKKVSIQLENIINDNNNNKYLVLFSNITLSIHKSHYDKLKRLYKQNCNDIKDDKEELFLLYLFCVLLRYDSLEGGGFQAALNEECFDVLLESFDCRMECFASPFNTRYSKYCSAFLDTDLVFGSYGSFFDFYPKSGCYEANPPFVPSFIIKMAKHMTMLLENSDDALFFIIVVPAWDRTEGWKVLKNSPFNQDYILLNQKDHGYCEGKQQIRPTRYRIASFHTSIFFWQNNAAKSKWPISIEIKNKLVTAFQSKQAEERIQMGLPNRGKRIRNKK